MKYQNINRRKMLQSTLGIAIACTTHNALAIVSQVIEISPIKVRLDKLVHIPSAVLIGRQAVSILEEKNVAEIDEILKQSINEVSLNEKIASLTCYRKHLAMRVREDFANGRTVMVDGWVFSLTEARLFALTSQVGGDYVISYIE